MREWKKVDNEVRERETLNLSQCFFSPRREKTNKNNKIFFDPNSLFKRLDVGETLRLYETCAGGTTA